VAAKKKGSPKGLTNLLDAEPPAPESGRAEAEEKLERSLRPSRFDDFVGQNRLKENLKVYVEAARARVERGEPGALDHVLFFGPPGLGKTTLSHILAAELGVHLHLAHGPAIEHKGQLAALLTKLGPRDVLFIDEIHRLSAVVEENLYTAMEDYRIDVVHGDGPMASTLQIPLQPFTLVGATTRTGLLTGPLLSRFGIEARLDYYEPEDLERIVRRSAGILGIGIEDDAAREIARRARGTPRIANRLLSRSRDFAEVLGDGRLDAEITRRALASLEVDEAGLDVMSRRRDPQRAPRHPRGRRRAVPAAAGLPRPHRPRPRRHRARLCPPRPEEAHAPGLALLSGGAAARCALARPAAFSGAGPS